MMIANTQAFGRHPLQTPGFGELPDFPECPPLHHHYHHPNPHHPGHQFLLEQEEEPSPLLRPHDSGFMALEPEDPNEFRVAFASGSGSPQEQFQVGQQQQQQQPPSTTARAAELDFSMLHPSRPQTRNSSEHREHPPPTQQLQFEHQRHFVDHSRPHHQQPQPHSSQPQPIDYHLSAAVERPQQQRRRRQRPQTMLPVAPPPLSERPNGRVGDTVNAGQHAHLLEPVPPALAQPLHHRHFRSADIEEQAHFYDDHSRSLVAAAAVAADTAASLTGLPVEYQPPQHLQVPPLDLLLESQLQSPLAAQPQLALELQREPHHHYHQSHYHSHPQHLSPHAHLQQQQQQQHMLPAPELNGSQGQPLEQLQLHPFHPLFAPPPAQLDVVAGVLGQPVNHVHLTLPMSPLEYPQQQSEDPPEADPLQQQPDRLVVPGPDGLLPISMIMIDGRWKVHRRIGSGSFGDIYSGVDLQTHEIVAIKVERLTTKYPQLQEEHLVYSSISPHFGYPQVRWFGRVGNCQVLIMELLGDTLEQLFNICGRRFSLKTVLLLAVQMIALIEHQHLNDHLHRDIKPDNFMMGLNAKSSVCHLIDMGLCKRYRDPQTGRHVPFCENKKLIGTPRYASLNTHMGLEQGRRDDLESIGYMLIYFLRGKLPWQGLRARDKHKKYEKIEQRKAAISLTKLCEGLPTQFLHYMQYCRGLKFDDEPDYQYLKCLFGQLYVNKGYSDDGVYDWSMLQQQHSQQQALILHQEQQQQQQRQQLRLIRQAKASSSSSSSAASAPLPRPTPIRVGYYGLLAKILALTPATDGHPITLLPPHISPNLVRAYSSFPEPPAGVPNHRRKAIELSAKLQSLTDARLEYQRRRQQQQLRRDRERQQQQDQQERERQLEQLELRQQEMREEQRRAETLMHYQQAEHIQLERERERLWQHQQSLSAPTSPMAGRRRLTPAAMAEALRQQQQIDEVRRMQRALAPQAMESQRQQQQQQRVQLQQQELMVLGSADGQIVGIPESAAQLYQEHQLLGQHQLLRQRSQPQQQPSQSQAQAQQVNPVELARLQRQRHWEHHRRFLATVQAQLRQTALRVWEMSQVMAVAAAAVGGVRQLSEELQTLWSNNHLLGEWTKFAEVELIGLCEHLDEALQDGNPKPLSPLGPSQLIFPPGIDTRVLHLVPITEQDIQELVEAQMRLFPVDEAQARRRSLLARWTAAALFAANESLLRANRLTAILPQQQLRQQQSLAMPSQAVSPTHTMHGVSDDSSLMTHGAAPPPVAGERRSPAHSLAGSESSSALAVGHRASILGRRQRTSGDDMEDVDPQLQQQQQLQQEEMEALGQLGEQPAAHKRRRTTLGSQASPTAPSAAAASL